MQGRFIRATVLLIAALALPLAGCGKKSNPKPPSQVEAEKKKSETE